MAALQPADGNAGDFWGDAQDPDEDDGWAVAPVTVGGDGADDGAGQLCDLLQGGQTASEEDAPAAPVAGPTQADDGFDGWAQAAEPVSFAAHADDDGAVFALMADHAAEPAGASVSPAMHVDGAVQDNPWLDDATANDNLWGASHTDPTQGW
jgi:hypothetical protein